MNKRRHHPDDEFNYERLYNKRRKVQEHQEIEDRLEALIMRVGEKTSNTLENNLEGLAAVLESDLATFRAKVLRILTDCVIKKPEKCTIYSTLIGLLNSKNYNFGGEFVENIVRYFKDFLSSHQWESARLCLRFLSDLVNCYVISASSLLRCYDTLLDATKEDEVPMIRKDWFVYAILSCLPWVGRELYEKKEQAFETILTIIHVYLKKRNKKHLPVLRVWSSEVPLPQEEYLDCLWAQISKLRQDKWIEKHISRPYLVFDHILSEALQHNIPSIVPPPHQPDVKYPIPKAVFRLFENCDCPDTNSDSQCMSNSAVLSYDIMSQIYLKLGNLSMQEGLRRKQGPILPDAHSIERFLIEEQIYDIITIYHFERKECSTQLMNLPYKSVIPIEYCIVEMLFGELMALPRPRYIEIFYGSVFIELCKSHSDIIPRVLAQAIEMFFVRIETMNVSCFDSVQYSNKPRIVSKAALHYTNDKAKTDSKHNIGMLEWQYLDCLAKNKSCIHHLVVSKPISILVEDLLQAVIPNLYNGVKQKIETLWSEARKVYSDIYSRLVNWLAYHLSNFKFSFCWEDWDWCVNFDLEHPQTKFIRELLYKILRLSYYERVCEMVPESFTPLLPTKSKPNFKYESDSNDIPGIKEARLLMIAIKEKKGQEEVIAILKEIPNPQMITDEEDLKVNPLAVDIFVQTLLYLGSKSFSHTFAGIYKFFDTLKYLSEGDDAKQSILRSIFHVWDTNQQMLVVIIDKLLKSKILDCASIANWIFSREMFTEFTKSYIWEIMYNTINKMHRHVSRLEKELLEMKEKMKPADSSDSEEEGEGEGEPPKIKSEEKITEEMVEQMEEKLEAAQADQKNLFLIIFQRFIMILSEHLVKCDTDGLQFDNYWYKWTIGRLQQIFLTHYETVEKYNTTLETLLFTPDLDPHILETFQQFIALRA